MIIDLKGGKNRESKNSYKETWGENGKILCATLSQCKI